MDAIDRIFMVLGERGMTQKKFAEGIGVRTATVSDWKRRVNCPTTAKYIQIADYLNVSLDYLLAGKEQAKNFLQSGDNNKATVTFGDNSPIRSNVSPIVSSIETICGLLSDEKQAKVLAYATSLIEG